MIRQISTGSARSEGYAEEEDSSSSGNSASHSAHEEQFERVINIKNCPLCHRPRMNSKAEMDIVTHLAVCASQDWARVDRIMVGNFVTANASLLDIQCQAKDGERERLEAQLDPLSLCLYDGRTKQLRRR